MAAHRHPRTPLPRTGLRPWVERLVLFLAAAMVLQAWYLDGLLVPCRVTGGSMAETLLAGHRRVVCGDCAYRFACDAESKDPIARAVCPNCGFADNDPTSALELGGERVLVSRSAFALRQPRRWEVVAFRHPGRASQIDVKRIVGLPGERIRIRHGDVYADGQIQRKTLPQQRAVAILVHDAAYQPDTAPQRWQGAGAESRWGWTAEGLAHPATADSRQVDWFVYHHGSRAPGRAHELIESPITDICGYNQGRPRREEDVQPVTDVMLALRLVRTWGRGSLSVLMTDGRQEFELRIDPQRQIFEVWRGGRPIPEGSGPLPSRRDGMLVEMSLFDQQLLLALGGVTVVTYPYKPTADQPPRPISRPLALGSRGLGVLVRDLRVYRDIYYTRPVGRPFRPGVDQEYTLGDEQYYVLGDNSPISEDSRTWPEGPGLNAKCLLGNPLAVVISPRQVTLGPLVFQVPDPERMRYIR